MLPTETSAQVCINCTEPSVARSSQWSLPVGSRISTFNSDLHLNVVRGWTPSRELLFEAMPSAVKALPQEPPRALREVDRLRENPENGGQWKQWRLVQVNSSTAVCLGHTRRASSNRPTVYLTLSRLAAKGIPCLDEVCKMFAALWKTSL